jgi:hypothetical protein
MPQDFCRVNYAQFDLPHGCWSFFIPVIYAMMILQADWRNFSVDILPRCAKVTLC